MSRYVAGYERDGTPIYVEKDAELETYSYMRPLAVLHDVTYIGGYVPKSALSVRERREVRFLKDRLLVFSARQPTAVTQVPYSEVENVEIGGPGLIKTGGEFIGGGFGVTGAVEGMAIAAVLNAITTRTSIKTILRIQGTSCELFLLHTGLTPEQLRIELSRPLSFIRSARATGTARTVQDEASDTPASPVEELAKLAEMLERAC